MINTPAILDIHPQRSFISALLDQGLSVYLLEWCPDPQQHRTRAMSDYILGDMVAAIECVSVHASVTALHVMGVCQAGYFSLCLNALKPTYFASIIPIVTPIDFHAPGSKLANPLINSTFLSALAQVPYIPGKSIAMMIQALDPLQIIENKWAAWASCEDFPEKQTLYHAIEAWSQDYPDQPVQMMREFFQEAVLSNHLMHQTLQLAGNRVHLKNITNPILNIYAKNDYFWSVETPNALAAQHASERYESHVYEGGHIGVFVGENALETIPARIAQFMLSI
jgi:polyhydroxyalkanoate synthase